MILNKNASLKMDEDFLCLRMQLDIVVNVLTNVYKIKFDIYQVDATISFQVSRNKPRRRDIVLQPISRYEG